MTAKKVITDTMDSKEIVALLKEDNSFAQHKFDETYKHYVYHGDVPRVLS